MNPSEIRAIRRRWSDWNGAEGSEADDLADAFMAVDVPALLDALLNAPTDARRRALEWAEAEDHQGG